MADLAGVKPPEIIDGISILPTLLGQEHIIKDRYMYWEYHERGFQQAARWNDWKVVKVNSQENTELYDLSVDPSERYNVADIYPEILEKMENYLKSARSNSIYWPDDLAKR